ncbi:hypothetical protein [Paenibacillus albidus]|uniref:hypothetical protein n=1 Tax=Paenibacillus albidus TaxID=2041023 RepID=UPI001666DFAD|nr:hypothetical protein [Paenibacillus albidus]
MNSIDEGFDIKTFIDHTYRSLRQRLPDLYTNHLACTHYEYKVGSWNDSELIVQLFYRYDTQTFDPFAPFQAIRTEVNNLGIFSPTAQGFLPFRALGNHNILTHFYIPDFNRFGLVPDQLSMAHAQITQQLTNQSERKKLKGLLKKYPLELLEKLDIEHTCLFKIDRHYYTVLRLDENRYAAIDKHRHVYIVHYRPTKVILHPAYTEVFNQSHAEYLCDSLEDFIRQYDL